MENYKLALFEGKQVRKTYYKNDWWFSVFDVVLALTDSSDPKQYLKKMRSRDSDLNSYWGTFCTPLEMVALDGKKRKVVCSSTTGIFRIIQSIPSSKAEPFKRWLAQVGKERIDEIENPELAMDRMKTIYENKGYPQEWIDKRSRGIAVRHTLTDEWRKRGVKRSLDFAILTNEIMKSGFGLTVSEYKKLKNLKHENLRDHMEDIELILTMLGEASTTKFTQDRDSKNIPNLKVDAKDGGHVAKVARTEIESKSSKSIISPKNFLNLSSKKPIK